MQCQPGVPSLWRDCCNSRLLCSVNQVFPACGVTVEIAGYYAVSTRCSQLVARLLKSPVTMQCQQGVPSLWRDCCNSRLLCSVNEVFPACGVTVEITVDYAVFTGCVQIEKAEVLVIRTLISKIVIS
ncbi:hypothetical protein ElyMa_006892100 [Elysia marginata]|uniref:Uncharacterized protein n=1 Tax=Elysia marginata TaxID=1093978 RepID=A0AAV4JCU3_9GAST|nr:hypothetical protein ElyMa_006892100 [Elysia marginata]